ncbi:hypothetical protein L209DRAFT_759420 [Thermothelomyces heterothallicus CBS 203.75]
MTRVFAARFSPQHPSFCTYFPHTRALSPESWPARKGPSLAHSLASQTPHSAPAAGRGIAGATSGSFPGRREK